MPDGYGENSIWVHGKHDYAEPRVQLDVAYDFVFVDEESFNSFGPKFIADLVANFRQYKDG